MGKEKNKKIIKKPHLIFCEGEDTTQFIIQYLEYLQKTEGSFESFQAFDFGGNKELPRFLAEVQQYTNFDITESITIIRDSENDNDAARKSIISALSKSKLPEPSEPNTIAQNDKIKVAFSLFPSLSQDPRNGTLEDLLIEHLAEDNVEPLLTDISYFLGDLKSKGRQLRWLHKSKLHTYFSVTDDFVSKKIGQASEAGAFNYNCDEMDSLKRLLKSIAL